MINVKLDGKAKATVSKTAGMSGTSIEVFVYIPGVTDMTEEVMEKLAAGKMILKTQNKFFFFGQKWEESGDGYTCNYRTFSCIPSRYEGRGVVCAFEEIIFTKYSNQEKYTSHLYETEMKQPTPIVSIRFGTVSSDNKLHYILDQPEKEAWMNTLFEGAILSLDINRYPEYSNKILYQRHRAPGVLYYVSALNGSSYGLYTIEFIQNDEGVYEMTISHEIYNIADHIEVSYPFLPGRGTQYTLTVGDKGNLSIDEAFKILNANVLDIMQFGILSMRVGDDKTSITFTTPVYNGSYYSIVLTPTGDEELTAIEVNITENAVGGSVVFNIFDYDNSESEEELEDGPILLEANNSNTWNNAKIYEEFNKGKICFIKCDCHRAFVSRITYFSGVYTVLLVGDTIEPGQMGGFG